MHLHEREQAMAHERSQARDVRARSANAHASSTMKSTARCEHGAASWRKRLERVLRKPARLSLRVRRDLGERRAEEHQEASRARASAAEARAQVRRRRAHVVREHELTTHGNVHARVK